MAVFEGVRAYKTANGPAIFRLDEHTKRLFNSAKIFQMALPYSYQEVFDAQLEVVKSNQLSACYLRPIAWIGSEKLGISARSNSIHMSVAAWEWGAYLGEDGLNKGIRVKTSSYSRHHVNVSLVRAKASGYYINSILANQEVTVHGYDEALLLDTDGYVSEGSGENVFIVRDGVLYTPDLASCLAGITRDAIITIAHDLCIEVRECQRPGDRRQSHVLLDGRQQFIAREGELRKSMRAVDKHLNALRARHRHDLLHR